GDAQGVGPAGVAVVLGVADLDEVVAGRRGRPGEVRVGEEVVVVAGQLPAGGVEDGQERVEVLLQVVDLVLQAGAPDLEGGGRAGLRMEVVDVHVLDRLDPATGDAGHRQRVGPGRRVVV